MKMMTAMHWLAAGVLLLLAIMFTPAQTLAQAELSPNLSFAPADKTALSWKIEGKATYEPQENTPDQRTLHLQRDPANLPVTSATSDRFQIKPGVYEITGVTQNDLYSPDESFHVAIRICFYDSANKELRKITLPVITNKSTWKRFKENFEVPAAATTAAILIEFNKTHGDFWVNNLSLKYLGLPIPREGGERKAIFQTQRMGCLFYPGDDVLVEMQLETPTLLSGDQLQCTWELTDYWNQRLAPVQKMTLIANGKTAAGQYRYHATLDLRSIPLQVGPYYEIHTQVNLGAPLPAKDQMSFAILPESATFGYDPMQIPFGAHTWNATVAEYFPLSARLGLRRCLVFWNWPKTAPYGPQFDTGFAYDSRIGWPKKYGMLPYGVLYPVTDIEHPSPEITPHTEEALRAGIRQSIQKYRKQGLWGFQIGNEPSFWDNKQVQHDVETYKIIYEEIKKTDPSVVAIGSAIGPNEAFFQAGFQAYQDVYNIHVYSDLGVLRKEMKRYQELFAKYGGRKPIWSTEIGSKSQGLPRHEIAKDLIRKVVCFMADGGEYFTWFATGGMPDPKGERSGSYSDSMDLFDSRYNMFLPRLDAIAYYHIINSICVKKFVQEIAYPNGVSGFLFRDSNANSLMVFWNTREPGDFFIPLPDVFNVNLTQYDGHNRHLSAAGRGINLRLSDQPLLLAFRGDAVPLPPQLAPAEISLVRLPENFTQGQTTSLTVRLPGKYSQQTTLVPPPFWKVSLPELAVANDALLLTYQVSVPDDCAARMATFAIRDRVSELVCQIPVKARIEVNLLPLPADKPNQAALALILSNNSDQPQRITWNVDLLNETPMQNGTFDFKETHPPSAYFTTVSHDQTTLAPRQTQRITLELANVDRLGIYKVRATAMDSNGNPATRQRLMGGFAKVPRAQGKIAIDGNLDEKDWQSAPRYNINEPRQVYYAEKDAHKWRGPDDLSGTVRYLWDDQYLYVAVEVTDDIFANPKSDNLIWSQDGLQFLINPYRQETQGKGRYDYALGLGQKGHQAWCNLSGDPSAPAGEAPDIKLMTKRLDPRNGNMVYEVAFPWSRLAPFKPARGANLGLAMIINEDDGAGRKSFIGWFSGVHLKETDYVGDLVLAP